MLTMAVFATILAVFSVVVFFIFSTQLFHEKRTELRKLTDAVTSSIDFDDDEDNRVTAPVPNLISDDEPETVGSSKVMRLEWYDPTGKFVSAKGAMQVHAPLIKAERFDQLHAPDVLMFTKPVFFDNKLLGFIRVAEPLEKQNRAINNLSLGLLAGNLCALIASGFGTAVLVRNAMAPIKRNMKQLKQFTSDASHELRNPITAILMNSSVALSRDAGIRESDIEKFTLIQGAAKQMERLVESLLRLSHAESTQGKAIRTNLAVCVQEVLTHANQELQKKNCSVEVEIDGAIEVQMESDDLHRTTTNLLQNAIKYSHSGGIIRLRALKRDSHVELFVCDQGIGIAANDLDKIFQRFWRADKARNHADGGQGLGLSIVEALVRRSGGDVKVKSVEGKGSTFIVSLKTAQRTFA